MLTDTVATKELISRLAVATPDQPVRLGRYDVTGLIGAGGMGTVYDAVDLDHGTRVAFKTLTSWDPSSLLRFKNEFRSVADLSHPNLVSLYELNEFEGLYFFTMDHIDGVDFVEWLRGAPVAVPSEEPDTVVGSPAARNAQQTTTEHDDATPRLPPSIPKVRDALAQLIAGLHALHQAGFLHLDIKPSNVLVDRSGQVFILDFGLIRRVDEPRARAASNADSFNISGTPMWMAPEQFTDAQIGKPADWYAVGLMLYWGLTGVPAFPPVSDDEAAAARLDQEPVPAVERVPEVPTDLSELAGALLHADANQRPVGRTLLELTAGAETLATKQLAAFVGRRKELDQLLAAHAQVREGGVKVLHIGGSSGLGKTALLRRFLHEVRNDGDTIALSSRCYERETVPYKAFDGLLDQLATRLAADKLSLRLPTRLVELVQVFPVLAGVPQIAAELETNAAPEQVDVVERRRRAVGALCELFENVAELQPLLLQIDDLQWADADSVGLLVQLLRRPTLTRLMVVLCFRPEEAAANPVVSPYFVASHELADRVVSIELGPLSPQDAQTLARQQLSALNVRGNLAEAIAQESGGIPFFVEELAHFAAQNRYSSDDETMSTGISLDEVLAQRVKTLPTHERTLVELLSVANSPIPLHIAFEEARLATGALRSLWALRGRQLIRTTGAGASDLVELHHDRMRESVLRYLSAEQTDEYHLGLARAFAEERDATATDSWLFDCVRHFNSVQHLLTGAERIAAARLNLAAARKARLAGAFPLAFECFRAGSQLLGEEAWDDEYELALALHSGAAETAHFSAAWDQLDHYIEMVKSRGCSIFDQLVGWEVHIDACIARKEYAESIDVAIQALRLLGTELPASPSEDEVGAAVQEAMVTLAGIGPEGMRQLQNADDVGVVASMRIMSSISSAAYFAAPPLLVVLACRLVVASVKNGLSSVTPYALSVYGIVLNTLGLHDQAHTWGQVALDLLGRFGDLKADARTRHVIHNLVCVWTVPLSTTLPKSREVVNICRSIGDVEYAGYATHGHVHNSIYAGSELGPLYEDALALGDFMRAHELVNALHVHEPFEQLLRCYLGLTDDPSSLDGNGFSEKDALASANEIGSSAGVAAINMVMGVTRYTFGKVAEAHGCFLIVRKMLDAIPSIWHIPIIHQYAALSIFGLPDAEREAHMADAEENIAALRHLAKHGPENFAHRVALVEAERTRVGGDHGKALKGFEQAISLAGAGGWVNDEALAHELAAKCAEGAARDSHMQSAQAAWKRWGVVSKLTQTTG
jgi:predicted ATPase